ncbi:MAG: YifB family Mg chelatase-like AAA ATPase [Lentisphaeria bacterium]|nr:YifB family Mg chelatase-like AAA ATPase [Lentisphaeria bacterium]
MQITRTYSAAVNGIDAKLVEIEVSQYASPSSSQDSSISIVGLPDAAVKESKERLLSAFCSSGYTPPRSFAVINLAPADLKKEGASFDLGIALALLGANGIVKSRHLLFAGAIGELSLDGKVRPVRGALPVADCLSKIPDIRALLVPRENAAEAVLAASGKLKVYAVETLAQAVDFINTGNLTPVPEPDFSFNDASVDADFADVKGQYSVKKALEIAAAGGHNIMMIGSPGTGKSMLAKRLAGILPPMTREEVLETSRIHSVLGMLAGNQQILRSRPFRSPHHTTSDIGLIGGGHDPRPGEISLAHHGVLFLDEFPEFKRSVLEVLRQPLENGEITVSRAAGNCTFPARFMLCAAMNPCPCGRGSVELGCKCSANEIRKYQKRISGPMLDRIDLIIDVKPLSPKELTAAPTGESSRTVRERVIAARKIQLARFSGRKASCNADMNSRDLRDFCPLSPAGEQIIQNAIQKFQLSPRAYDRILKVSRTISDLKREENISTQTLSEAISLRKSNFLDPDAE